MKALNSFKSRILSITNRYKESLSILFILIVLICTILTFYGFNQSSKSLTNQIDSKIAINLKICNNLSDQEIESLNKSFLKSWLEIATKMNDDYCNAYVNMVTKLFLENEEIIVVSFDDYLFTDKYHLIQGRTINHSNEVIIKDNTYLNSQVLKLGETITIKNHQGEDIDLIIVGIFQKNDSSILKPSSSQPTPICFMSLDDLLEFSNSNDLLNVPEIDVVIYGNNYKQLEMDKLNHLLKQSKYLNLDKISIEINDELANNLKQPIVNIQELYFLISFVIFLIVVALLISSLLYIVKNRMRVIGIYLSLGVSKFKLFVDFTFEILILLLIAYIICIPISYAILDFISQSMFDINQASKVQLLFSSGNYLNTKNDISFSLHNITLSINDSFKLYLILNIVIIISSFISFIKVFASKASDIIRDFE